MKHYTHNFTTPQGNAETELSGAAFAVSMVIIVAALVLTAYVGLTIADIIADVSGKHAQEVLQ